MSIYWPLLLLTALVAYLFGSMDTMVLASNFVFHRNLLRLGNHNSWLSNFRRLFGIGGFFRLLAVELVKDLIPILIGSLLLGIRGHADVGRAFAGFVLVLGRLWPALYRFPRQPRHGGDDCGGLRGWHLRGRGGHDRGGRRHCGDTLSLPWHRCRGDRVMVTVLAVDDALVLRLALTAALVLIKAYPRNDPLCARG